MMNQVLATSSPTYKLTTTFFRTGRAQKFFKFLRNVTVLSITVHIGPFFAIKGTYVKIPNMALIYFNDYVHS